MIDTMGDGAIIANEVKPLGVIVFVELKDFAFVLEKVESPLVIMARIGIRKKKYQYLTPYKGMIFVAESTVPLQLPKHVELINADRTWIPH